MDNKLIQLKKHQLENTNHSYSKIANAFLSKGYTSSAGNTYFNSIRFSDGIIILENIGKGYKYTFLNGIEIYSIRDKILLGQRRFHNIIYNKQLVRNHSKKILKCIVKGDLKNSKVFNLNVLDEIIDSIVDRAMDHNQEELMKAQKKNYFIAS
tara:strand:+ start:829 stop:1287 length:459 start_codon:yes stop_codon:yes gene_type:complete